MAEMSERAKQDRDRAELWAFISAVLRNWHTWLGTIGGLGVIFGLNLVKIDIPPWIVPWIMSFGVVIGCFYAWRSERRAKEIYGNLMRFIRLSRHVLTALFWSCLPAHVARAGPFGVTKPLKCLRVLPALPMETRMAEKPLSAGNLLGRNPHRTEFDLEVFHDLYFSRLSS